MKVYRVEVTKTLLVMAESEIDAMQIAEDNAKDEPCLDSTAYELGSDAHLSNDEKGSLVWHEGNDDVTIEEALTRASAP